MDTCRSNIIPAPARRPARSCPQSAARWRNVLAVECDGATYHRALWARERDRMRQEVLENMGWKFHRIWSTDWFYRRANTFEKLKTVLEAAKYAVPLPEKAKTRAPPEPIKAPRPTTPPPTVATGVSIPVY